MADTPLTPPETAVAQRFTGVVTEVSEMALPPGAMVKQVNLTSEHRGVLRTRDGLRPVTFDE